jgi:hypothetical protein
MLCFVRVLEAAVLLLATASLCPRRCFPIAITFRSFTTERFILGYLHINNSLRYFHVCWGCPNTTTFSGSLTDWVLVS